MIRKSLDSYSDGDQAIIKQTEAPKQRDEVTQVVTAQVEILDEDDTLGGQLEQWALDYTSQFITAAGPRFHSTTMAHIIGHMYVKKGLPEVFRSF